MRHQTVEELRSVATIAKSIPSRWELRRQRLHRWAQLIEESRTPVRLFHQLEYMARHHRLELRAVDSPLSIAFADPHFRLHGLVGTNKTLEPLSCPNARESRAEDAPRRGCPEGRGALRT
jgi:hypothetical protein